MIKVENNWKDGDEIWYEGYAIGDYRKIVLVNYLLSVGKNGVGRYEGESNENRKTEIKIRNIASLSYKLADMLPML
jgi:hypothetical protein